MKKILIVTTTPYMIRQFLLNDIKILKNMGYMVEVATNFKTFNVISSEELDSLKKYLIENKIKINQINFSRSFFDIKSIIDSYRQLQTLLKETNYTGVHMHTPIASAITRLVIRNKYDIKTIYTAHGFHFFKGAPLRNWLLYYPIEKYLSKYTDILITINREDYQRAKNKFKMKQIKYIPGVGIDVKKISNTQGARKNLLEKLGIINGKILLSVGEISKRKNHCVIINCLPYLPQDVHYVIIGKGKLKDELQRLARNLDVFERVHFVGYKSNVIKYMKSSDIFVFPSLQEGLSVALMEAMASGIPCLVSDIRGNNDLIKNGVNGYTFKLKKNQYTNMVESIHNLLYDKEKVKEFNIENKKRVEYFSIEHISNIMLQIYENF